MSHSLTRRTNGPSSRQLVFLICALLVTSGPAPARAMHPRSGEPDALREAISARRRAGDHEAALAAALAYLDRMDADDAAAAWEREDARRIVRTLETIGSLPEAALIEMAEADRLEPARLAAMERLDFQKASGLAERQLKVWREHLGEDHPETAARMAALAEASAGTGDWDRARELHRESVAILRKHHRDHPALADQIDRLARFLIARGRTEEIEKLVEEAHAMRLRLFGAEHPDVASSLLTRLLLENRGGDREERRRLASEALAMRRRIFGEEHLAVAESLDALGNVETGFDYRLAERYTREALAMRRRLLGEEHPLVEQSLVSLAEIVRWAGDPAEARDLLREVIGLQEKMHGKDYPGLGTTLNNLALAHRFLEEYEAALPLLERAVEIYARVAGDTDPGTLTVRANLAMNHAYRGDFDGATVILDRCRRDATRMAREHGRAPTLGLYDTYQAQVEEMRGNPAGAERIVRRLVEQKGPSSDEPTAATVKRYMTLGRYRAALGDLKKAFEHVERAARAFERARQRAGEGLRPATFQKTPYEQLALIRLELGEEMKAWPAVERARGRVLADLLLVGPEGGAVAGEPYTLRRVQASLNEQTAIVGWLDFSLAHGMPRSWGYVIRHRGPVRWERLKAGNRVEEMSRELRDLRDRLGAPASPLGRRPPPPGGEMKRLWKERFAPLEPHLEGVRSLVVIPSWVMGGFPIEVLTDLRGRMLGDRFDIAYAPSATVHAHLRETRGAGRPRSALFVGDPPFNESQLLAGGPLEAGSLPPSSEPPDSSVLRGALKGDRMSLSLLPPLRWSRHEVAWAARAFRQREFLVGPDASEDELFQRVASGNLGNYDVVHIATHALIDNERPERSGLVLSQLGVEALPIGGKGAHATDGIVTGSEIMEGWKLDAELVALSACQTALGRNIYGEGVVGLSYPFFKAGARSLLVSLWQVNDQATALLMRRFYESWLGDLTGEATPLRTKAEALREAKQWLRTFENEEGVRPYEHPFYWSAFVLIGDGS